MRTSASGFYQQLNLTHNHSTPNLNEGEKKQVLITDDVVFKNAMTRDYRSIQDLSIIQEDITFIDNGNIILKQLSSLRRLDLSFNKLTKIDNLDSLKELRELNLSFNQIEMIEHLGKLPNLRVVTLNHNKIRKIENLKNLRKLEVLNLAGNLIEDMSV